MANNEFAVERAAGIDMVPLESFEWNPELDDVAVILRYDFQLNMPEQVATGGRGTLIPSG